MISGNRECGAGGSGAQFSLPMSVFWEVSPICSRLQEHVALLNGNCSRDRLFLQSPMTNQLLHPFASPFLDSKQRITGFFGKISNASGTTNDALLSEERPKTRDEAAPLSPYNIHKFLDHEALISSQKKSQKSSNFNKINEFKPYSPSTISKKGGEGSSPDANSGLQEKVHFYDSKVRLPVIETHFKRATDDPVQTLPKDPSIIQIYKNDKEPYYEEEDYLCSDDEELDNNDDTGHFNQEAGYAQYEDSDGQYYEECSNMYQQNGDSKKMNVPRNYSYVINENGDYERIIRKRKRKSQDQLKTLMREFDRNANWSKETLLDVSKKTGLSEAQVYKWGWDQKRKKYGPEVALAMGGMPPMSPLGSNFNEETFEQDYHKFVMTHPAMQMPKPDNTPSFPQNIESF